VRVPAGGGFDLPSDNAALSATDTSGERETTTMTPDRLLDRSSEPLDPPADLSLVFRHPQGLLAARAIARSLITQAQRAAQTTDSRQPPAISPSGPGSLSTPDMDLSSASMLSTLLAFTEPQPPTPGEGLSVPQHPTQDGRDQGPEMPDKCMLLPLVAIRASPEPSSS
jgi:hypothetical protein